MPTRRTSCTWRGRDRDIWVADTLLEVNILLSSYADARMLSMDLEYLRQSNEPGVVSLSPSPDVAILWHRPRPDESRHMPHALADLLTSPACVKFGFAIDDDLRKLAASTDLLGHGWPRSILDIQMLYRAFCPDRDPSRPVSMVEVVNQLLAPNGGEFDKLAHDGDWSRDRLTDDQILYAAGDVFVVWEVIDALSARLHLADPRPSRPPSPVAPAVASVAGKGTDAHEIALAAELELDIMAFLKPDAGGELPRPERLRNHVVYSCPAVARLPIGERQKAAVVERALTTLAQRGAIRLCPATAGARSKLLLR